MPTNALLPTMSLDRAYPTEITLRPGSEVMTVDAVLSLGPCTDAQESYVDALVQRGAFHEIYEADREALRATGLGKTPKILESLLAFDSADWGPTCDELILTKAVRLDPTAVTNQIIRLRTLWMYMFPLNELADWLAQCTGLPASAFRTEHQSAQEASHAK